jgi:hypothetical protein
MNHLHPKRRFPTEGPEVHEGPGRVHPHTQALEQPDRDHELGDGADVNWEHDWIDLGGEG